MKKVFFVTAIVVMVCGVVFTGCPEPEHEVVPNENNDGEQTGPIDENDDGEQTETPVPPTQPVPDNDPVLTSQPVSVKDALAAAKVSQYSTNAGYISMGHDNDIDSIILTYKVGTIEKMFLQYLSNVVVAAPGRKFTYTETVGQSESQQTENMNTLVINVGANAYFAGAKASASAAAVFLGFGAGASANAKASVYSVDISFDLTSVTQSTYTETYANWLQISNSIEQDMSVYEPGKEYAVAAFADIGVYQVLKYNPRTRTATAIPGRSLYFNVESEPVWDMYEYSRNSEMEIAQKLTLFDETSITVSEADLYQDLTKSYSIRKGPEYDTYITSSSTDESFDPGLYVTILECFGYDKVKIDVAFGYRAEPFLWFIPVGGDLRLQIMNADKSAALNRKDFSTGTSWTQASYSTTVDISSLKSPTCKFILRWNTTGNSDYHLGTRTVTITAVK